jgi:hypothetical protein
LHLPFLGEAAAGALLGPAVASKVQTTRPSAATSRKHSGYAALRMTKYAAEGVGAADVLSAAGSSSASHSASRSTERPSVLAGVEKTTVSSFASKFVPSLLLHAAPGLLALVAAFEPPFARSRACFGGRRRENGWVGGDRRSGRAFEEAYEPSTSTRIDLRVPMWVSSRQLPVRHRSIRKINCEATRFP